MFNEGDVIWVEALEAIFILDQYDGLTQRWHSNCVDSVFQQEIGRSFDFNTSFMKKHAVKWSDAVSQTVHNSITYSTPYILAPGTHATTIYDEKTGLYHWPKVGPSEYVDTKNTEKHLCHCDRFQVVNFGCKCGGR